MTPDARELIAEAQRRAQLIPAAKTQEMRRALARRVCFDLIAALRRQPLPTRHPGRPAHHPEERIL